MRGLAATVLTFEALVVFFASLVASQLSGLPAATALAGGGVLALACVGVAALLRFPWAYWLGSFLQVIIIATGFVVPLMFFLGAVFAALWIAALRIGARFETGPRSSP